jgi:hypothetical protein
MSIILQEKIAVFLLKNRGRPFCDDCISRELSTPIEDVRRETEKMRTWAGFVGMTLQSIRIFKGSAVAVDAVAAARPAASRNR